MKIEDARLEVTRRINEACGFSVKEEDLTPRTRQSITALAIVLRQLIMIKQLVMVEQTTHNSLSSRIGRAITRKEDVELNQNLLKIQSLQKDLNERVAAVSRQTLVELENKSMQGQMPGLAQSSPTHFEIEALKCGKCGASLGVPNARFVKCDFCGTVYSLNEYLDRLGMSIRGNEEKSA